MSEDRLRLVVGVVLLLFTAIVLAVPRIMRTSQEALRIGDATAGALFALAMTMLIPIPTSLMVLLMVAIAVLWAGAVLCIASDLRKR